MRYLSVGSTSLAVPKERRRLELLCAKRCRRPARERMTLPVPVILNRFATAFLVLFPRGRLIKIFILFLKKSAQYKKPGRDRQEVIWKGFRNFQRDSLTVAPQFERLPLDFKGKTMYAVLETGGKQYRVAAGDKLEIERLAVDAGKPVEFDRVLLVNLDGKVTVGAPAVTNARVVADVLAHVRGEKKIAFKMRRRKGYHRTVGHRQELTVVQIKEIKA